MKRITILATSLVLLIVLIDLTDAWRGNYKKVTRIEWIKQKYCACWYGWWGCSYWRHYWKAKYVTDYYCQPGWSHNGDKNCNIPVCRPKCQNGGNCTAPNTCQCPSWSSGIGCGSLTCSYKRPCYPGNCINGNECTCEDGFKSQNDIDGCITFDPSYSNLRPVVGKSNVTLSHIRRTDDKVDFMFILEGLEEKDPGKKEIIWSNQKRFNNLRFEYETSFIPPENLPKRPNYVHESKIGISESLIEANVSKVPRNKGPIRDSSFFKTYKCEAFRDDSPEDGLAICVIDDDQFTTLIEHGDWLNIKFKSKSGGFQQLVNTDEGSTNYDRKIYNGLQDIREVQFNFDFIAPKHCLETDLTSCPGLDPSILRIENEFTKDPIKMYWSGWMDDLSGLWQYYVEVFKLSPNIYGRLVEAEPLKPVYNTTVQHSRTINYPSYTPKEPGMYSVLVETRDIANNSRISRRLVLFDDQSDITLNTEPGGQLYVSSAVAETGYKWQTAVHGQQNVKIDLVWTNHFINEIIEDNKLLYSVEPYPIQFKDIQDDGILYSQKFVNDSLDDHEGRRTLNAITNFHGIVKFEWAKDLTLNEEVPTNGWIQVTPLKENTSTSLKLLDGSRVRLWVRATDVMGNVKTDSTFVRFDGTKPKISKSGENHKFERNIQHSVYNYTSRLDFTASDEQSGVHKLEFSILVKSGDTERKIYNGTLPAAMSDNTDDPLCSVIENQCFIAKQTLYLDNCWFLVRKSELESSTATVNITAYNQALLGSTTTFNIGEVKNLQGLEKYSGPENIRIESLTSTGFRVVWDLPEKVSCYGRADIVLVLLTKKANQEIILQEFYVSSTASFFDIQRLEAETEYVIDFGIKSQNTNAKPYTVDSLKVKTQAPADNTVIIAAATTSTVVFIIVVVIGIVCLARHGYIHPVQKVHNARRAVNKRVRKSIYSDQQGGSHSRKVAYDDRQSELYIYGDMDMDTPQIWHIDRHDITFETLIKSGHFANIYKARLKKGKGLGDVVVAKTLKEKFTSADELLMKAKINFTGGKVGEHPNILTFIGAVVHDDAMGPFIIYEYCENGTLRDYLADRKNNVTMELQENLFRFGLDIVKGMEFLAGKGIVHRRLAARNILLTFLNEVKISGFGPQPSEDNDGDAEKGKKERIPIKWVAPECMESTRDATEKSDVWSYAVVLWEIFTLGETPYTGKGTDLPKRLKKGERLAKPELCDNTWYATMKKCWSYDASKRPTFYHIRQELDNLFVAAPGDDYYFYKR